MLTWRPIPCYEGYYEVSDQGNVRSLDRIDALGRLRRGRELKPRSSGSGYMQVALNKDGSVKQMLVHRLVLIAFEGEPEEGMQACHSNGDKSDNRLDNLRWGTSSENNLDKIRHGTHPDANKTHCPRGHPYMEKNNWPSNHLRGHRDCKACGRVRGRVRRGVIPMKVFQEEADREFDKIAKEGSLS